MFWSCRSLYRRVARIRGAIESHKCVTYAFRRDDQVFPAVGNTRGDTNRFPCDGAARNKRISSGNISKDEHRAATGPAPVVPGKKNYGIVFSIAIQIDIGRFIRSCLFLRGVCDGRCKRRRVYGSAGAADQAANGERSWNQYFHDEDLTPVAVPTIGLAARKKRSFCYRGGGSRCRAMPFVTYAA